MTDTETICACITACWSASMTVIGYWLKKRKAVSVEKIIRVNVQSDEVENEQIR
jgi:hypothetical protein